MSHDFTVFDLLDNYILLKILKRSDPLFLYVPRLVCRRWAAVYKKTVHLLPLKDRFIRALHHDDIKTLRLLKGHLSESSFYQYAMVAKRNFIVQGTDWRAREEYLQTVGECRDFLLGEICGLCKITLAGRGEGWDLGHRILYTVEGSIRYRHHACLRAWLSILNYYDVRRTASDILEYAAIYSDVDVMRILVEYYGEEVIRRFRTMYGRNISGRAATEGNFDILFYLLNNGFYADEEILYTTIDLGDVRCARYILTNHRPSLLQGEIIFDLNVLIRIARVHDRVMGYDTMMNLLREIYEEKMCGV